jgi:hypothetical protein
LLDLLELLLLEGLEGGVLDLVRVALQDQLSMRRPDFREFGVLRYPEAFVRIGGEGRSHDSGMGER